MYISYPPLREIIIEPLYLRPIILEDSDKRPIYDSDGNPIRDEDGNIILDDKD